MSDPFTLYLADEAATDRLGAALAALANPGDLLLLKGELGAGKSALARAFIRALLKDPEAEIPSPSFSLVQPYEADGQHILHADLYRLSDESELEELGLFDGADTIALIEWPERAPVLAQRADIAIALDLGPKSKGRLASIEITPSDRQNVAVEHLAKAVG